jgi:hypothetical protein
MKEFALSVAKVDAVLDVSLAAVDGGTIAFVIWATGLDELVVGKTVFIVDAL